MKSNLIWQVLLALLISGSACVFGQAYPQLVCDSVSASKSKCGFKGLLGWGAGSTKLYLSSYWTESYSGSNLGFGCRAVMDAQILLTVDPSSGIESCVPFGQLDYYDINGVLLGTCAIECGLRASNVYWPHWSSNSDWAPIPPYYVGEFFASGCGVCVGMPAGAPPVLDTYYESEGGDPDPGITFDYYRVTAAVSDEYTTALLISNTVGALPLYPGTFTGTCSAYRDLSSDETNYSIQRFKYKFTFDAATESFVIHWIERFTPVDNGSTSDTSRCEQVPIDATETSVYEVLEPTSNGTTTIEDVYVEAAKPEVQQASIQDGEFVIAVPELDCSANTGTLDLIVKREDSNDEVVLKTLENQSPGTITVRLEEVMDVDASPLDGQDGIVFDRAAARWRAGEADVTSDDQDLDVPVEVLSQRTLSNYFSPTWNGSWRGTHFTKGVYPYPLFPSGLYNVDRQTEFLNALDPMNEGLAMDATTVIRLHQRPVQPGFPPVEFLPRGSGRYGYIEFPDRIQSNTASGSTVQFLRSTSVAVRPNADRLNYRTADQVYVPGFGVRTVDDAGGLHGNTHQIDIWIGQGDSGLRAQANDFGIRTRTCLKLLNQ